MELEKIISGLNHLHFFLISLFGFSFLYFTFSTLSYFIIQKQKLFSAVQHKSFRPGQIKNEILRSFLSIIMFSVLALWMCQALKSGIYKFVYDFNVLTYLIEVVTLFFWNEIYFFVVHKLFHTKQLYKYHLDHHYSFVPSPFSAYSFHWSEGLLLGAVMPVIMFFHDFQFYAIMTLPIMSIVLNALGHSNLDFFPKAGINSLLSFSKRHSLHHQNPHKHFGFFLPWLDMAYDLISKKVLNADH